MDCDAARLDPCRSQVDPAAVRRPGRAVGLRLADRDLPRAQTIQGRAGRVEAIGARLEISDRGRACCVRIAETHERARLIRPERDSDEDFSPSRGLTVIAHQGESRRVSGRWKQREVQCQCGGRIAGRIAGRTVELYLQPPEGRPA